jgi:hypothetical protein
LKLVKSGYGTLGEVKEMSSREVVQALHYEKFIGDYEAEYLELNKAEK